MTILTFRDFTFRATHHIPSKHGAASLPHWHTYTIRMWFLDAPDQDTLSQQVETHLKHLHGNALNSHVEGDTSDENLAAWFHKKAQMFGRCMRVRVTNDGQRGAEIMEHVNA